MRRVRFIAFLALATSVLLPTNGIGQRVKPKNLDGKFNGQTRRFHFGFGLGYMETSLNYTMKPFSQRSDSVIGISAVPTPGFIIEPLAIFHIDNNWKIKASPLKFSLEDRLLKYTRVEDGEYVVEDHRVESTYISWPMSIKWRTNRINNWCAFLIGTAQYSLDLASNQDVNANGTSVFLKLNKTDYSGMLGGGFDFFLEYFKFGIELKYHRGFRNIHVPENNYLSNPIDKIYSQNWQLSFTFEG